jgi:hypothetical protein
MLSLLVLPGDKEAFACRMPPTPSGRVGPGFPAGVERKSRAVFTKRPARVGALALLFLRLMPLSGGGQCNPGGWSYWFFNAFAV